MKRQPFTTEAQAPGPTVPRSAPRLQPQRVRLSIESLHLPGYSDRDAARLAGSLECELARILARQDVPSGGYRMELLELRRFHAIPGERPERTGRRLGALLAEGLRQ